ncbi:MAG: hypothetical protein ACREDQ_00170 [Limisphaerales bacterium]
MTTIFALHRYWIYANRMRECFDKAFLHPDWVQLAKETKTEIDLVFWIHDPGIFMSYWYGGLYVVVEGWQELGLNDSVVDQLLKSPNVKLLKRYRNGIFHFQKHYMDERFHEFMESKDCVPWVRQLNRAFGDYFAVHPG